MKRLFPLMIAPWLTGCTMYAGSARDFDAASLEREPGWLVARDVPLVMQKQEKDCGSAALVMALQYWSVDASAEEIGAACVATEKGYTADDLREFARRKGLKAFLVEGAFADLEKELPKRRPAIVGLVKPYLNGAWTHWLCHVFDRHIVIETPPGGGRQAALILVPSRVMREQYQSGGLSVELYDARGHDYARVTKGDVAFFIKHARRTGGPVLELGSGTGRVTLPLARAGFDVVGLDLSPHMLRVARSKVTAERFTFVTGDMARFDLHRKFGLVIIPFRAFQHLATPEEQRACLECVRRHLKPRGRFIVDLFDPKIEWCVPLEHASPKQRNRVRHPVRGNWIDITIRDRVNDPFTQTFSETWIYAERDAKGHVVRTSRDVLSLRWTYRWEMRYLLELCGFKIVACHGDFRGGPPRYGAEQIWICGRA